MNNQWRIENVRNFEVLLEYALDRSYGFKIHSQKRGGYMPDDRRLAVSLIGLTWPEMKMLMRDIGDQIDADAPPAQEGLPEGGGVTSVTLSANGESVSLPSRDKLEHAVFEEVEG